MSSGELKISDSGVSYARPTPPGGLSVVLEFSWLGISSAIVKAYSLYRILRSWRHSDAKDVNDSLLQLRKSFWGSEEVS